MDINVMVVNVGNTRIAIGVFLAGELTEVRRLGEEDLGKLPTTVDEMWKLLAGTEEPAIAGASVNPARLEAIELLIREHTGQQVQWVGRDIDLPIEVLTENPQQTGVDRVLNVAAAYEQMQKACVVVDAGTALTVNVCNDNGQFIGGAIAPGATMQLNALHERTAQLPAVRFRAPSDPFGMNTEQAMLHGAFYGIRGMVKELVEHYATEMGNWPEIIATGGDAEALFDQWELIHAISPDLTLYGIALAYSEHHIKHGDE